MTVPETMKAAVWVGPGEVEVQSRPVPTTPHGFSLVQVSTAGVCATDHELVAGRIGAATIGVVPGHEITGRVVQGHGSSHVEVGQRVVVDCVYSCDVCPECAAGRSDRCLSPGERGFTADGGWAEYIAVPTTRLHAIADHLSDNEAVLIEPFAMTFGALLDCGEPITEQHILIVGQGLAAYGFAAAALALDAGRITVSIKDAQRRLLFESLSDRVTVVHAPDTVELADVGVDSVGNDSSIRTTIEKTRFGGLIVAYGLAAETVNSFPLADVVIRNLRISGHTNPKPVWPRVVALLNEQTLCTAGLVDRVIGIDELPAILKYREGNLRTVIRW